MAPSDTARLSAADVFGLAERLEERFRDLLEAGLFEGLEDEAAKAIDLLSSAFMELERGDAVQANRRVLDADQLIHEAVYTRSWWWRFKRQYRPAIVVYNMVILVIVLAVGAGNAVSSILGIPTAGLGKPIWGIPPEVLAFGCLGAILRTFYWVGQKTARGTLRPQFQLSYVLAPWIGLLFGALVYAVVKAGLWTLQGDVAQDSEVQLWAVYALAALAGYRWEWVTERLAQLMTKTSVSPPASATSSKPADPPAETSPQVPVAAAPLSELPAQPGK